MIRYYLCFQKLLNDVKSKQEHYAMCLSVYLWRRIDRDGSGWLCIGKGCLSGLRILGEYWGLQGTASDCNECLKWQFKTSVIYRELKVV